MSEQTIPYGSQWIRDLVPNVSWDNASQSIVLPDGQRLDKSAYTIVNDKAYVRPETVAKYVTPTQATQAPAVNTARDIVPAGAPVGSAPQVATAGAAPPGTVWIRDLVPDVSWDNTTQGITLPGGQVLPKNLYTLVGGKAYVNPTSVAQYYAPKPVTADTVQSYYDKYQNIYQPVLDNQYNRLDGLITTLQSKLAANMQSINAQGDASLHQLQNSEDAAGEKLRNQAIARGTYTSGVADYQQQQLSGDYSQQYADLANTINAAINSANVDTNANMQALGEQATMLEDNFTTKLLDFVNTLIGTETGVNQQIYDNMVNVGMNASTIDNNNLSAALARTEMFGRVVTANDAQILGVPVGTLSSASQLASLRAGSGGGPTGGSPTGGSPTPGTIDPGIVESLSVDEKRAFDTSMDIWKVTGKAPAGILQTKFNIPVGTAYDANWSATIDSEKTAGGWYEKIRAKYPDAREINVVTAANALTDANGSGTAAVAMINANRDAIIAQGANPDKVITAIRALGYFEPTPEPTPIPDGRMDRF